MEISEDRDNDQIIINGSILLWLATVLFIYLTKGEINLVDRILSSISISFGITFGELMFEKQGND